MLIYLQSIVNLLIHFKNRDGLQIYPKSPPAHQIADTTPDLYMNYRKQRRSVDANFLQRSGFKIHPFSALKKDKPQLSFTHNQEGKQTTFVNKYDSERYAPLYQPEQAGSLSFEDELDQFQFKKQRGRIVEDEEPDETTLQTKNKKQNSIFPYSPLSRQLNQIILRKRQIRTQEESKTDGAISHDSFRQKLKQAIDQLKRNQQLAHVEDENQEHNQSKRQIKFRINPNQITKINNQIDEEERNQNNFGIDHIDHTEPNDHLNQSNARRVTRHLAKSDPNLKIQLLQLGYKQSKVDKPPKMLGSSKVIPSKNKKSKKKAIKKHQQLQEQWQFFKSIPPKQTNFQALLLCNLPSRNPIRKHQYNCQSHLEINFHQQLIENRLYFTSEILNYDFKQRKMKICCNPAKSLYIGDTLKSTRNCRTLTLPPQNEVKKIKLRRNFQYTNRKILVLDLDQTLVHSQGLGESPNKELFPWSFQFQKLFRYYSIRNYAREFLRNLSQKYYIVIFTSAVQGYADCILQTLDPEEKYVQHRLYRQHCYLRGQGFPYIKDLRILNRDLSQVVIVDNSLYAFWFQIDNGVPITSFMGTQDQQLRKLEQYLLRLQLVDDIRVINRRAFHMHLFQQSDSAEQLLNKIRNLVNQEHMKVEIQV